MSPPVGDRPERWVLDAGEADVALLDIPAVLHDERVFEIDVRLEVRHRGGPEAGWHALKVELDGAQVWARRLDTPTGNADSLDYHCRRAVPAGQALRVRALTGVGPGVQRRRLHIEAELAQL
ncbi:hypothetical protein [Ideonella dechloratans]|uniref:hypothetical protein n=1 Tax=Ideonella dechloratans TaxID=36863 RepID=UPI0035B42434